MVEYIRAGEPITEAIGEWLVALASPDGWHGYRLELIEKRGRKSTSQEVSRDIAAYDYYNDLCEQFLSKALVTRYADAVQKDLEIEQDERRVRGRWITGKTYCSVGGSKRRELNQNELLPKLYALHITAKKTGVAFSTLRKVLTKID